MAATMSGRASIAGIHRMGARPDEQHRARGRVKHSLRHTTEHQPSEPDAAMATHHDELRSQSLRLADDRGGRGLIDDLATGIHTQAVHGARELERWFLVVGVRGWHSERRKLRHVHRADVEEPHGVNDLEPRRASFRLIAARSYRGIGRLRERSVAARTHPWRAALRETSTSQWA